MSKHIFTTDAGVEIPLTAIPPLQGQMVDQAARKDAAKLYGDHRKPTYTLTTDDGGEETHEHDEETIKSDPEARRAWDAWKKCQAQTEEFVRQRMFDFAMLAGTEVTLPEDRTWIKRQRYLGIDVPAEDPEDDSALRAHYIRSELLRTPNDLVNIQHAITALSRIDEESLAAARATFSGDAQKRRDAGDVDSPNAETAGRLDGEPALQRVKNRKSIRDDT